MRTVGMSETWGARWTGRAAEGILGGLTLLVGAGTILALGFGPWTCEPSGRPCYGLLGPNPSQWLDLVAIITTWLPLLSVGSLGAGAVQNVRGQRTRFAALRWPAALVLSLATLLLVVSSPLGVYMIPLALIAYLTASVGHLRAQRGEAPASVGTLVFGSLATVAVVAIVFLTVQNQLLTLR